VLCGLKETAWPFAQQLLDQDRSWLYAPSEGQLQFLTALGTVIGARNRDAELSACLQRLAQGEAEETGAGQLGLLSGLAEGLQRAGRPLRTLLIQPPAELEKSLRGLQPMLRQAQQMAALDQLPAGPRVLAIQVLARVQPDVLGALLLNLLKPGQPVAVQSAAARSLAETGDRTLAGRVLDTWGTLTTGTRGQLLASLLRSPDLAGVLITALEQGKLAAAELDPVSREALRRIPDKDLQRRAAAVLAQVTTANRQEVMQRYQPALRLTAERQRGATVFAKHCLACHQVQGQGHRVGPDLSGVASRPKEALLEDILDPSKNVAPDFLNYVLVTARGQVRTGLLTAETATTVKLRLAEGAEDVVLRSEIQELRSTGKSLMPEGLEQVLNPQDIADLIEFMQKPGPLPAPDGKK
jgi:putative heme-binding domain-containing protein